MTTRIKLRRDTAANWLSANPILAAGEPGLETDTGKIKYGDGVTAYANLPHAGGDTLNDEGGVTITAGSTKYWVAAQRKENFNTYSRGVRHDSLGNVYSLTQTYTGDDDIAVITKYSPTGTILWQQSIEQATPTALAVDSSDNAYIALENGSEVHLIKFVDAGGIEWKKIYDAGDWQGEAFIEERTSTRLAMTLNRTNGGAGQVLVLDIDTTTGDVVAQKLLSNAQDNMYAAGIDTDGTGNVVVTGRYRDSNVNKDKMFVEKLNGSLDRVWSKSLETANDYNMDAGDCASDAQGNVYAVGFYQVDTVNVDSSTGNQTAGVLVKLNSSGVVQWTRRLGPGPCGESVVGLTATDVGEVYLVSQTLEYNRNNKQLNDFQQIAESTSRMIVAKYDTAGAVLWQRYVDAEHVWEDNDDFRGQTISVFDDKFVVDFYGSSWNTIPWNFAGSDDNESEYFLVQLPTNGTELTIGEVEFRESRIPGRFVEHETTASPTVNEVFESTITVTTSSLAPATNNRVANALVKSESYDYVFGPDGTLTIPNDGDVKLTQTQKGFFAVIGDTVNYDYDTQGRAVTADSFGNTYVVGEDDNSGQPIVVKISPEGYRLWTVSIEDDGTGSNGRANAIAVHPISGNVVVACEFYGNYYYGAVVTIDQDTGRILANNTYIDESNDVYLNDIVFQSNGDCVVGGSKNGAFAPELTVTAQAGSASQKLVVLRSEVTARPSTNWQIGGTGFNNFENIYAIENYYNLTSTVSTQGSGAVFTVEKSAGSSTSVILDGTPFSPSSDYITGSSATRNGTAIMIVARPSSTKMPSLLSLNIGDTLTMNGATVTLATQFSADTGGGYTTYTATSVESVGFTLLEGDITFSVGSPGTYSVLVTNGGSNYLAGHRVKILGTELGGTTPANDITITIDAVDAGVITSVSNSGTPTSGSGSFTGLTGTNQVGSGFVFSWFAGPTISSNYNDHNGWNPTSYGGDYVVGDVIKISGDQLGGTTPANDLSLTVWQVGGSGEATGFNISGTAQSTTWTFETNTNVDFSQPGSWQLTYPLSRENILIGDGWSRTYGTNTGDQTDRTYAIAVDSDDNIITATQGYGVVDSGQSNDLAVVYKFNSTGTLQWARKLNELVAGAEAKGVTTIGTDIYATHYSYDAGDTVITRLDAEGNIKWQQSTDSASDSSISSTPNGDLIVVAEAYNSDIGDDAIKLFRLTSDGETVYKRWLFATTENDTRFKNGRCLAVKGDSMYITSYYYADDYDSWFVARLPVDGSGTGENNQFRYMDTVPMTGSYDYPGLNWDTNYIINRVTSSYAGALTIAPVVNNVNLGIASTGDLYVNTYYPSYFYEDIRDQDGGNIVFADGTKQNTSATDIPQRIYTGAKYTLGLRDRGHHIYCQNENRNIIIPYDARVPFPIGTTITLVNDSGSNVYIYTEGGGTQVMLPGNGFYTGFQMDNYGVATLLKIGREKWVITGNVSSD